MRTKSEILEEFKDCSITSLKFFLGLSKFFRMAFTKEYWFVTSLVFLIILQVYNYERLLLHPLWCCFIFIGGHFATYKLLIRNLGQMNQDYKKSVIEIEAYSELLINKKMMKN